MTQHFKLFSEESEHGLEDVVNEWLDTHPTFQVRSGSLDFFRSSSEHGLHDTQRYRLAVFYEHQERPS